jgi:hypothetical protein
VDAGAGCPVRPRDNDIACDERISVKEILNGVGADLCFPPYSTCSQLQRTEDAVAGPDEYELAYDRRRMRKSTACFKVPQG